MDYHFGGAPDDYARAVGSLSLLPSTLLTVTDATTGSPVTNLRDHGDPAVGGQIRTDASGEYDFDCESPVVVLAGGGRTWKVASVDGVSVVLSVMTQAVALAGAAQTSAADAAASRAAAQAAQAAAEAAAAGGGGGWDGEGDITASGTVTFQTSPVVPTPAPAALGAAVPKSYADGLGQSGVAANTIVRRDAEGQFQAAAPSAAADVATKSYVDNVGDAELSASTIVRRDSASRVKVADPAAPDDAASKGYADSTVIGIPTIDATDGSIVPPGTPEGTLVVRLATPDPAPKWSASGETTNGTLPISWTVPVDAVPGQVAVVVCVMAGTGTWTYPSGATPLYASQQGAGMTVMVYGVQVTSDMLGTARQVSASSMPGGTRAKVTAYGFDGVTLSGATTPSLSVQGTATATPTIPGVTAPSAGVALSLLLARLTAIVADGQHWTGWPGGTTETYDDAVATTGSVSTVSVAAAAKVLTTGATVAALTPTSDLGAVQYIAATIHLPALVEASSGGGGAAGAGAGTDPWLRWYARDPEAMAIGVITRTSYGCPTSFPVEWPFGTGTGTATLIPSVIDPKQPDSWTVTYVPAGGGATKTVTQPEMTRDPLTGAVTTWPDRTVA